MILVNVKLDLSGYKRILFVDLLVSFISNGIVETKLAILTFLYCEKLYKDSFVERLIL